MKTLETATGFDEPTKELLAKPASPAPNKEQIVFVPIRQKTGFANVNMHYTRNTKFWISQKKEMEIIGLVRIQNVKFISMRWAAKPERLQGYGDNCTSRMAKKGFK